MLDRDKVKRHVVTVKEMGRLRYGYDGEGAARRWQLLPRLEKGWFSLILETDNVFTFHKVLKKLRGRYGEVTVEEVKLPTHAQGRKRAKSKKD